MRQDNVTYLVTNLDEGRAPGIMAGAGSFIPSIGLATSAIDMYRTVGIHSSNLAEMSMSLTDIMSINSLSKVAEGGISSHLELQQAEVALQALLLHDFVNVITYGPKILNENGLVTYGRPDHGLRSKLGFEIAQLAEGRDWLVSPEIVSEKNGIVISSSHGGSSLIGKSIHDINPQNGPFEYGGEYVDEALNAAIFEHGLPTYLSKPSLLAPGRGQGFEKRFYHKMKISWDRAVGNMPMLICPVNPPPLLAIVMNRLNNRQDLLGTLSDLRKELVDVRLELQRLNEIITSSRSQEDIESLVKHWDQSFDDIVRESRMSNAERNRRIIGVVHKLGRSIFRPMVAFFMRQTGLTLSDIEKKIGDINDLVSESDFLVNRTVTAATFSALLRTESLQVSMKRLLTAGELASIDKSIAFSERRKG